MSYDNTVWLWDTATGEPLASEDDTFQFLAPLEYPLTLYIEKYPSTHIIGSTPGNIDPSRNVPLCWLTHDIKCIAALAYAGSRAALGCEDGRVMLFDVRNVHLN